jgi:hypothetical protein
MKNIRSNTTVLNMHFILIYFNKAKCFDSLKGVIFRSLNYKSVLKFIGFTPNIITNNTFKIPRPEDDPLKVSKHV